MRLGLRRATFTRRHVLSHPRCRGTPSLRPSRWPPVRTLPFLNLLELRRHGISRGARETPVEMRAARRRLANAPLAPLAARAAGGRARQRGWLPVGLHVREETARHVCAARHDRGCQARLERTASSAARASDASNASRVDVSDSCASSSAASRASAFAPWSRSCSLSSWAETPSAPTKAAARSAASAALRASAAHDASLACNCSSSCARAASSAASRASARRHARVPSPSGVG